MEHTRHFDWDKYCNKASFKEIRERSPLLLGDWPPSMYSPDSKFFYLSSIDDTIETSNQDELLLYLHVVSDSYAQATRVDKINHKKAYISNIDFIEMCGLLAACASDPEKYADPEALLLEYLAMPRGT